MTVSVRAVTVDCSDVSTVAAFWAEAVGLLVDKDVPRDREVARLVDLGATHVADKDEWGHSWAVLTDPEGNEFCVATEE